MNNTDKPPHDESDDALDRAISAVAAQPPPPDVKKRVLDAAVAFTRHSGARLRP